MARLGDTRTRRSGALVIIYGRAATGRTNDLTTDVRHPARRRLACRGGEGRGRRRTARLATCCAQCGVHAIDAARFVRRAWMSCGPAARGGARLEGRLGAGGPTSALAGLRQAATCCAILRCSLPTQSLRNLPRVKTAHRDGDGAACHPEAPQCSRLRSAGDSATRAHAGPRRDPRARPIYPPRLMQL